MKQVMNNIFKKFLIFGFALSIFFAFSEKSEAASFNFSPSAQNFTQTCVNTVDIRLDSQGAATTAADIRIFYSPSDFSSIDINGGSVYPAYFGKVIDSGAGEIQLTGANFFQPFIGSGVFARLTFQTNPGITTTSFSIDFAGAGNTLDSNIADAITSNDLLTSVTNGTYTFSTGSCINDTTPPVINFVTPRNNQTGIPANASVSLGISDALSGVDITTVEVVLNGVSYTTADSNLAFTGTPANYSFILSPNESIPQNQASSLLVKAYDNSGNFRQASIVFNVPVTPPPQTDNTSPNIEFISPINQEVVEPDHIIVVEVNDIGSGVDADSVQLILDGRIYTTTSPQVVSEIIANGYRFILTPQSQLVVGTHSLTVFALDNSGNGVLRSINFSVEGENVEEVCFQVDGDASTTERIMSCVNAITQGDDVSVTKPGSEDEAEGLEAILSTTSYRNLMNSISGVDLLLLFFMIPLLYEFVYFTICLARRGSWEVKYLLISRNQGLESGLLNGLTKEIGLKGILIVKDQADNIVERAVVEENGMFKINKVAEGNRVEFIGFACSGVNRQLNDFRFVAGENIYKGSVSKTINEDLVNTADLKSWEKVIFFITTSYRGIILALGVVSAAMALYSGVLVLLPIIYLIMIALLSVIYLRWFMKR